MFDYNLQNRLIIDDNFTIYNNVRKNFMHFEAR